jgi:hypothetical protein
MRRRIAVGLLVSGLFGCSSESARLKETRFPTVAGCADSFLLHLDADTCAWKRIDGLTGSEATLLSDWRYCAAGAGNPISVHPTESRLFVHIYPDDDRRPEIVRELLVDEGVLRTASIPRETYVDYSGYDDEGRLTVVISDELPEPGRAMRMVNDLFGKESCAIGAAKALTLENGRWVQTGHEVAKECGDPAPVEELRMRLLAPSTMTGTTTVAGLTRVKDPAVLQVVNAAMEDPRDPPVWHEKATPYGRILRGSSDYGEVFWIAFLDTEGRLLGKPTYEENPKLRLRGRFLLTALEGEENGRLYDLRTGRIVWEAPLYSSTVFWPCPSPTP